MVLVQPPDQEIDPRRDPRRGVDHALAHGGVRIHVHAIDRAAGREHDHHRLTGDLPRQGVRGGEDVNARPGQVDARGRRELQGRGRRLDGPADDPVRAHEGLRGVGVQERALLAVPQVEIGHERIALNSPGGIEIIQLDLAHGRVQLRGRDGVPVPLVVELEQIARVERNAGPNESGQVAPIRRRLGKKDDVHDGVEGIGAHREQSLGKWAAGDVVRRDIGHAARKVSAIGNGRLDLREHHGTAGLRREPLDLHADAAAGGDGLVAGRAEVELQRAGRLADPRPLHLGLELGDRRRGHEHDDGHHDQQFDERHAPGSTRPVRSLSREAATCLSLGREPQDRIGE